MSKKHTVKFNGRHSASLGANDLKSAYLRIEKAIGKPDERPLNRAERRALASRRRP